MYWQAGKEGEHLADQWAPGRRSYNHEPQEPPGLNHLADPREEERQAGRRQVRTSWGRGGR